MAQGAASDAPELHLCVLVHGLWGNPKHLSFIASRLQEAHPQDQLRLLIPKSNANNLTYDGIEVGGERVTEEVEEEIKQLTADGKNVAKFSIIGYSLGGLFARYAVGLLFTRGYFDRIQPVNFCTFASPHLGVRSPVVNWRSQLFNLLVSRSLSTSGHQLFMVDSFRDTGKPLLVVLAEPNSIFVQGLQRFKNKSLYANIINDRSVPYFTAAFSRNDPFQNLDVIKMNFAPGYGTVILDSDNPAEPKEVHQNYYEYASSVSRTIINQAPFYVAVTMLLPLSLSAFLINAGVQTYQSARRVKTHEMLKSKPYRLPLFLENAQRHAESALEVSAANQPPAHVNSDNADSSLGKASIGDAFANLAYSPEQLQIIESLENVGFKRHRVWISAATHSHAAVIVRMPFSRFHEGKVVARHWVERFEI